MPNFNQNDDSYQMKTSLRHISITLRYCILSILLVGSCICSAQTVWTGIESSDWFEAANWSNGYPSSIEPAVIPEQPIGGFLPTITQDINISFTITNANILTFFGDVTNNDSIINYEDGAIINYGTLTNTMIIDNDGEFYTAGDIINDGTFDNSGILTFDFGDTFINNTDGVINNYGPVNLLDTYFSNNGTLNLFGDTLSSSGELENFGTINNNGILQNLECGIIRNHGSLNNPFIINNFNIIYDDGIYSGNPITEQIGRQDNSGLTIANHECTDQEGWTHYSDSTANKMLLSIYTNGQDIGSLFDQSLRIQISNDIRLGTGSSENLNNTLYSDADDWYLSNRSWLIKSTIQDTMTFKVRFYFDEADYQDIQNTFPLSQDIRELIFFKLSGTQNAYDPDIEASEVNYYEKGNTGSPNVWLENKISFSNYAEIETTGLNGAFSAGVKSWLGGTIPFQLSFQTIADQENQSVNIEWSTGSESFSQDYTIQHSDDGISFSDLKTISAVGNATTISLYSEIDNTPNLQTINYYRLKLLRADGTIRYSDIREVRFASDEIDLFPNPSNEELYIRISDMEEGAITLTIYDINGQMRFLDSFEVFNNVTTQNIYEKVNLAAGVYTLQILGSGKRETFRFIKVAR